MEHYVIDAFRELPDYLKLLIFVALFVSSVGLLVWKLLQGRRYRDLQRKYRSLRRERNELLQRFEALDRVDEHVWKRPDRLGLNRPTSHQGRTTRFIAVCNLKGGVGKTTVTLNLGAGLALQGKRVLLVDLDFQGTLSGFLLPRPRLNECREKDWTTDMLLRPDPPGEAVRNLAFPVEGLPFCHGMVARESLELAEFREQARYFVNEELDPRFRLQRLFHVAHVLESYDYVLFDCPPRMTTACINALTCADHVLVPTTLSEVDIESVRRTLHWLQELRAIALADFLGVIVSRCRMRMGQLIRHDRGQRQNLEEFLRQEWSGKPGVFEAMVQDSPEINQSATAKRPGVLMSPQVKGIFEQVCAELQRRIHP